MMNALKTPGVYVFEVPPTASPITGVGTSTAAFLGISGVLPSAMPEKPTAPTHFSTGTITYTHANRQVTLAAGVWPSIPGRATLTVGNKAFAVESRRSDSIIVLAEGAPDADIAVATAYELAVTEYYPQANLRSPTLVTNWDEFKRSFGDFNAGTTTPTTTPGNEYLAHAVYGFFSNGGTRCYVVRIDNLQPATFDAALSQLGAIDEVAVVAAPLPPNTDPDDLKAVQGKLLDHCELQQDRFAILDSVNNEDSTFDLTKLSVPGNLHGYGGFYFPWLVVTNPLRGSNSRTLHVPPCGHIAGIYARSDASRGVFKAPANEAVLGIQGLAYPVTKNQQEGLNPSGVNCIRSFYGTSLVWGARTVVSGNANADQTYRYVNIRRYMNFLRESIMQGTNWAVFEPNSPALWKRITRSVGDFLLGQWRDGALFGETPQQAFYVRCDATTNPQDVRDQGQVVTEIGVAIVKPAEFVVFRIQQ